mgnify:FL=1
MSTKEPFNRVAPGVLVAGQLEVSDIDRMVEAGVRTLVCNRPDGEGDQPSSQTLAAAAEAVGIDFVYLPMANPEEADKQSDAFKKVLARGGVVLAYCRTGRRSTALWEAVTKK